MSAIFFNGFIVHRFVHIRGIIKMNSFQICYPFSTYRFFYEYKNICYETSINLQFQAVKQSKLTGVGGGRKIPE